MKKIIKLDDLKEILDNHKLWLKSDRNEGSSADLRYANLRDANLRDADLSYADLRHTDLSYANLRDADLSSADLRYANLRYADLRYADLSYADLRYADLRYADLSDADLRDADLRYADLSYADLDFSAFPLWCGGLDIHIDDKQAKQFLYHLIRNVLYSKNTSQKMKKLCSMKSLIKQANEFHRINECGKIKLKE